MKTWKLLQIVGLMALTGQDALACTTREYAQYKDRARADVMALARLYCLNKDLWDIRRNGGRSQKDVDECGNELSKIADAIDTAKGKAAAFKYIEQTCPIK